MVKQLRMIWSCKNSNMLYNNNDSGGVEGKRQSQNRQNLSKILWTSKGQSAAHCQAKRITSSICIVYWAGRSNQPPYPWLPIQLSLPSGKTYTFCPSLTWSRRDFNFPIRIRWQLSSLPKHRNMTFEVIFMWNLLMLPGPNDDDDDDGVFTTLSCVSCADRVCVCVRLFVSCDCLQNSCQRQRTTELEAG